MDYELFYEPIKILQQLDNEYGSEMSQYDMAFICGLIKEYKPKKILELGVAAGGTTAVIMNCCHILELDTAIYSVDIAENYYRDSNKKTGYLAEKSADLLAYEHFNMYRNDAYLAYAEQIGSDIDMVIIDTVHSLPGEVLDFLSCFPFVKMGGVVVLHDILLNHLGDRCEQYATKLLLDTVVGEKIVGSDETNIGNHPNIGAFTITDDTKKYISDVFSALTITWNYLPDKELINKYILFFRKYYSEKDCSMFLSAIQLNENTLIRNKESQINTIVNVLSLLKNLENKEVYIYGCGKYGKLVNEFLRKLGIKVNSFIISDNQEKVSNEVLPVKHLSEVRLDATALNVEVLIAVAEYHRHSIEIELSKYEFKNAHFLDDKFFTLLE